MNTYAANTEMTLSLAHHTGAARVGVSAVPADVRAAHRAEYRALRAERRAQLKAAKRSRRGAFPGVVTALGPKRVVAPVA